VKEESNGDGQVAPNTQSAGTRNPVTSTSKDSPPSGPLVEKKQPERSEKNPPKRTLRSKKRKRDNEGLIPWADSNYESETKSTASSLWVDVQTRWVEMKPVLKRKATANADRELRKAIDRFKFEMSMATEEADDVGRVTKESSTMLIHLWKSLRTVGENEKEWIALDHQLTQLDEYANLLDCMAEFPSTQDDKEKDADFRGNGKLEKIESDASRVVGKFDRRRDARHKRT
jgi:hypothetical protein